MSSLIRDAIFDYDIQRADGFTITPMAMVGPALRWEVRCSEAKEIVNVGLPMHIPVPKEALNRFVKLTLQDTVDRMWSRWWAL